MDALLAYNVLVDECFKFSITMLLNSTIMLVIVLHYASICSYASILLLCSKLCQHNLPRPTAMWEQSMVLLCTGTCSYMYILEHCYMYVLEHELATCLLHSS